MAPKTSLSPLTQAEKERIFQGDRSAAPLDEEALLTALEREGDTLAARAVWLSWQGG